MIQEIHTEKECSRALVPAFTTSFGAFFEMDCLELFGHIRSDSIDTIFADPPFNLSKDYGNGKHLDRLDEGDYLAWCRSWITEGIRVIKPGGAFFIYILPRWGYHFASILEAEGMQFRHWIALSMKGTFPRGNKLYPAHYCLLYFTKGSPATFNRVRLPIPSCRHCGGDIKDYGGHRKYLNPAGLNLTDFWDDTSPSRHQRFKTREHVNELKPMIPSRCFEISTNPGDLIMDPFGGGGSSFEAAEFLGRFWIGSELVTGQAVRERMAAELPLSFGNASDPKVLGVFSR